MWLEGERRRGEVKERRRAGAERTRGEDRRVGG